jgi:hypothetical protein
MASEQAGIGEFVAGPGGVGGVNFQLAGHRVGALGAAAGEDHKDSQLRQRHVCFNRGQMTATSSCAPSITASISSRVGRCVPVTDVSVPPRRGRPLRSRSHFPCRGYATRV